MKRIVLITFSLILASCTTQLKVEPTQSDSSMVVGTVIKNAENFQYYGRSSVNGEDRDNIQLTILNHSSGELFEVKTNRDGFFYFDADVNSKYQLVKIYYISKSPDGSWADLYHDSQNIIFSIDRPGVSNLGTIYWYNNFDTNYYMVNKIDNFEGVRDYFSSNFDSSLWNSTQWYTILVGSY